MATVTNMLPHRHVSVRTGPNDRDGGDKLVHIGVGESAEVADFDEDDEFHAGLLANGDITVGAATRGGRKASSENRGQDLKANLEAAQRAVSQAEDRLAAAKEAQEQTDTPDARKAISVAAQAVKSARKDLADAEKAFSAG